MSLFNVDLDVAADLDTPLPLQPGLKKLIQAFLAPFKALHQRFSANRYENVYRLRHTGQVAHMEAVLNDAFDNTLRRIVIIDGPDIDSTYVYLVPELKTRFIYKTSEPQSLYIRKTVETSVGGPDFVVQVPSGLTYDTVRMRALVDDYRLASKSYYLIVTA